MTLSQQVGARAALVIVAVFLIGACSAGGARTLGNPVATATPLGFLDAPTAEPAASEDPEPTVKPLPVKVVKRTKSVRRNGTASVTIKTSKQANCSIDVRYSSGSATAKGLGVKTANADGEVTWKWKVGGKTTKGTWPIYIGCELGDRTGEAETAFTVK